MIFPCDIRHKHMKELPQNSVLKQLKKHLVFQKNAYIFLPCYPIARTMAEWEEI